MGLATGTGAPAQLSLDNISAQTNQLGSLGANVFGIEAKPDGSKLFVGVGDFIHEYTMSTPGNLATASLTDTFNTGEVPYGLWMSNDGLRLYIFTNRSGYKLEQRNLGTAWDLTTIGGIANSITLSGTTGFGAAPQHDSGPNGLTFGNTENTFWIVGSSTNRVYEWSTTPPGNSPDLRIAAGSDPHSVNWNDNGTELLVMQRNGSAIETYSCPAPYDITGMTLANTYTITGVPTSYTLKDFAIPSDNYDRLYLAQNRSGTSYITEHHLT